MTLPEALNVIGAGKYGDAWRPYCPVCLNRASRNRIGTDGSQAVRHGLAVLIAPPLAGLGWVSLFDSAGIIDDRYLTSRITFFLLSLVCAVLFAVYGGFGLARQRGWFHAHPRPEPAVVDTWTDTAEILEDLLADGRLRAHALTVDGDLHAIDAAALPATMIRNCIDDRTPEQAWRRLRRTLGLSNAPAGQLVLNRGDLDRVLSESNLDSA